MSCKLQRPPLRVAAAFGGHSDRRDEIFLRLRLDGRGPAWSDLLQKLRSDGNRTTEWATVGGDQQHGQRNACRKERESDSGGDAVVAVDHGNPDQRAEPLKQYPRPFDGADVPLADDDALTSRIERRLKRLYHFGLRGSLAVVGGLQNQRISQSLGQ